MSKLPDHSPKTLDVCALGEVLVDFTPVGIGPQGNPCFERNPGGAPANVLATLAKNGRRTAFIGKVGDDLFGSWLRDLLMELNIDTSGLSIDDSARTTLAFVQLDEHGEREFSFYRNPGADVMLSPDDVDLQLVESSRIFHCGSLSLTNEPARSATQAALAHADHAGCVISYDPNLRLPLWSNPEAARESIISLLPFSHILKVSDEELEFLTGVADPATGTALLSGEWGMRLIVVTLGEKGCFYRCGQDVGYVPGFKGIEVVDTTGAGDIFMGTLLTGLLREADHVSESANPMMDLLDRLNPRLLEPILLRANAAAGLCITKRGAIPSIPEAKEIEILLHSKNH